MNVSAGEGLACACALAVSVFVVSIMSKKSQDYVEVWKPKSSENSNDDDTSTTVRFQSDGVTLVGHLYLPAETKEGEMVPVIVMCMGLGLTQDAKLHHFVEGMVKGCHAAVFTFDYKTFGESAGFPRHQVKPMSHVRDIQAAVQSMREHPRIDKERVCLWGSSLGGGHALLVAARDPTIKATVALVPHTTSGLEAVLQTVARNPVPGLTGLVKVAGALLEGIGNACLLGKPAYLLLHGPPGSAALMQNPGDDEGYGSLPPKASHWRNSATVGSVLAVLFYRPLNQVKLIQSPTLLIAGTQDTLCPPAGAVKASKSINGAELILLPETAHFDVYGGPTFVKVFDSTVSFFKKHL